MPLNTTVSSVLRDKDRNELFVITSGASIQEAAELMAKHNIGALPVVDENGRAIGLISERRCLRNVLAKNLPIEGTTVGEVMDRGMPCADVMMTVAECYAIMMEFGVKHLPVIEGQKIVGMISMTDVVSSLVNDHEFEIEQLANYIFGPGGELSAVHQTPSVPNTVEFIQQKQVKILKASGY